MSKSQAPNERLMNSESEGEVYVIVTDGKVKAARYVDGERRGSPDVAGINAEFEQNDGPEDPVGTAPPLVPEGNTVAAGTGTALSGHLVQGFPTDEAPANPITPEKAFEIAVEQGVGEAVSQEAADKQAAKQADKDADEQARIQKAMGTEGESSPKPEPEPEEETGVVIARSTGIKRAKVVKD